MPPYKLLKKLGGDPDGTRTRVAAVKGRSLNRLTTGPFELYGKRNLPLLVMVAAPGFEPGTLRV